MLHRGVFRTQSNIGDGLFFAKIVNGLSRLLQVFIGLPGGRLHKTLAQ